MKKVLVTIGVLSIVFSLYSLFKGESFQSLVGTFVCGFVILGFAFTNTEKKNCKTED